MLSKPWPPAPFPPQPIIETIWSEKYRWQTAPGGESTPLDSVARICAGVYAQDPDRAVHEPLARAAMEAGEWCPGGRILAGAGTTKAVTLINCFVNMAVPDTMEGIMGALSRAALTMQRGGGIGTDFSPLRPKGAVVRQTGSVSSGPLSFMEMWNAMCATIMSGGSRRGAMMATLACDHPDLRDFITAKTTQGRLTNFNVSVLITDAFMQAVETDSLWDLGFSVPPADREPLEVQERNGQPWYVYERQEARALWDLITRTTYDYAEPGVIFIDRVNGQNNLGYCETIHCTNPCGEQPLPPDGDCNLGAVNLSALVRDPFTPDAHLDQDRMAEVAAVAVRFLDNVLEVSAFPVPAQKAEAMAKRRLGIGIMGLGTALQMLGLPYGSERAREAVAEMMDCLRDGVYRASAALAKERGAFPLCDIPALLDRPFLKTLPEDIRADIAAHGLRNGCLMTVAPTGTTAIFMGNVTGGLEPPFALRYSRAVLRPDGGRDSHAVLDAGFAHWCALQGHDPESFDLDSPDLPDAFVTATDLSVDDHLAMQAVCQQRIDASISKTINCPEDMPFGAFERVYRQAYALGCKGCTTYRPSPQRGAVLSTEPETKAQDNQAAAAPTAEAPDVDSVLPRPEALTGRTYKLKWPLSGENFYVTINDMEQRDAEGNVVGRRPFELFIASRSAEHAELMSALTLTLSAILRRAPDPTFIVEDLERVRGAQGAWVDGQFLHGVVPMIAGTLRRHLADLGIMEPPFSRADRATETAVASVPVEEASKKTESAPLGEYCRQCHQPTLIRREGCATCLSCGYSDCG
ncbi:MAG: adenosylcobalamin-dependent ribonucleoside-diphosphate reductase [Rhodospirillaceae bacterium]